MTKVPAGEKTMKVRLTRSLLGRSEKHRRIAKALGLTKMNDCVVHRNTPVIQGMIRKISHLLTVEVA